METVDLVVRAVFCLTLQGHRLEKMLLLYKSRFSNLCLNFKTAIEDLWKEKAYRKMKI